jgi:hypothetical protein
MGDAAGDVCRTGHATRLGWAHGRRCLVCVHFIALATAIISFFALATAIISFIALATAIISDNISISNPIRCLVCAPLHRVHVSCPCQPASRGFGPGSGRVDAPIRVSRRDVLGRARVHRCGSSAHRDLQPPGPSIASGGLVPRGLRIAAPQVPDLRQLVGCCRLLGWAGDSDGLRSDGSAGVRIQPGHCAAIWVGPVPSKSRLLPRPVQSERSRSSSNRGPRPVH